MLDKFIGINSVTLVGTYLLFNDKYFIDTSDGKFELLNEIIGATANNKYIITGSFYFKDNVSYIRVNSFSENHLTNNKNNILIVGEVIKVNLRGTQDKPWADAIIAIKTNIDDVVVSDIVKVILSSSSLDKIYFDINSGDWLGVTCHKTNSKEFALKVNSIREHLPKKVRDFWTEYKNNNY